MIYLNEQDIINIHDFIINEYSPNEPIGIIHPNSLNETVNSIQQEVFGVVLYPSIEAKAGKLFYSLVMKHIFANGNKRTAVLATTTFLGLNGKNLTVPEKMLEDFAVEIDDKKIPFREVVKWIKKHTV